MAIPITATSPTFHVYRDNVSPLWGEKPILDHWVNAIPACYTQYLSLTKSITFFSSTAGGRLTIPTVLGVVIEEVRAIFAPQTFSDPISSFAARGYWKFVRKCPRRMKMLITWLCVSQSDQIKNLKHKRWKFRKKICNESLLKCKFMAKIPNFDTFWTVFPHFFPLNVKFGTGEMTCGAKNPFFGRLMKRNTGMAALRAGLSVIMLEFNYWVGNWE